MSYVDFFLNSASSVVELECIEISHSALSKTYRIVRNAVQGITVTHEDAVEYDYEYYPLKLSLSGPRDDLDHILSVQLGDLGEVIPAELDRIMQADGFDEYPVCTLRTFRSDDLTTVLYGPIVLQIDALTNSYDGTAFEAKAPSLNNTGTGERYTLGRFPMLKGLL